MAVLAFRSWDCDHGVCAFEVVCAGTGVCRLGCSGRAAEGGVFLNNRIISRGNRRKAQEMV